MAWASRKEDSNRSLASAGRCAAETDAAFGTSRALAPNRSNRRVVKDRWRIHRSALRARGAAQWNSLCPRAPTGFALRARTNLQVGNPAKIETTFRLKNYPRHSVSDWLAKGHAADKDPGSTNYAQRIQ